MFILFYFFLRDARMKTENQIILLFATLHRVDTELLTCNRGYM